MVVMWQVFVKFVAGNSIIRGAVESERYISAIVNICNETCEHS